MKPSIHRWIGLAVIIASASTPVTAQILQHFVPVAEIRMLGEAGSAVRTTHPAAFFHNPAHLGWIGRDRVIAVSGFLPEQNISNRSDWNDRYTHGSFAIGTSFTGRLPIPLSIGIGALTGRYQMDYEDEWGDVTQTESSLALGVGLRLDYPIWFAVGATGMTNDRNLVLYDDAEQFFENRQLDVGLSAGYTHDPGPYRLNLVGSHVIRGLAGESEWWTSTLVGPRETSDPQKWTIRGYGLSAEIPAPDGRSTGLEILWTQQVSRATNDNFSSPRNMELWNQGFQVTVMDAVGIGAGSIRQKNAPSFLESKGFTLRSAGLMRLANRYLPDPVPVWAMEKLDIRYGYSQRNHTSGGRFPGDRFQEISLAWRF